MLPRICAIVVTYKSSQHVYDLLHSLAGQVSYIYVVDNGSDQEIIELLKKFSAEHHDFVSLICNETNVGIASAQNQAIRLALADGFHGVLLMDDDSLPEAGMVQKLLMDWQIQNNSRIGIIAPRLVEQNISAPSRHLTPCHKIGFKRQKVADNDILLNAVTVISSGSIIFSDVFRKIGLMREGFFIDYVDHEFCLRAISSGYQIMVSGNAVLFHRQGNKRNRKMAGLDITTLNYAPLRYYYIFRNRMFFLRLYGKKYPFLVTHDLLACTKDIIRVVFYEDKTLVKLHSMLRGLMDGIMKPVPDNTNI